MKTHHLKLNQLRFVVALQRRGKLALAAEELHISQPAASRMLAEIEAVIGHSICSRNAHGVVFNELGNALATRSRRIVNEMEWLGRDLSELADGRHGQVRIGAVTTAAIAYVMPASLVLRALAPRVRLQVDVEPSATLMQRMRSGDYDFVLGRLTPDDDPSLYDVRRIGEEVVQLIVRENHPLSKRRAIRFSELSAYEWVMQPPGAPIWTAISNSFHAEGARFPEQVTYTASVLLTLSTLSKSDAIAPIAREPVEALRLSPLATRIVPLDIAAPTRVPGLSIIAQRDSSLSPIARKLLDLVELEVATSGTRTTERDAAVSLSAWATGSAGG